MEETNLCQVELRLNPIISQSISTSIYLVSYGDIITLPPFVLMKKKKKTRKKKKTKKEEEEEEDKMAQY